MSFVPIIQSGCLKPEIKQFPFDVIFLTWLSTRLYLIREIESGERHSVKDVCDHGDPQKRWINWPSWLLCALFRSNLTATLRLFFDKLHTLYDKSFDLAHHKNIIQFAWHWLVLAPGTHRENKLGLSLWAPGMLLREKKRWTQAMQGKELHLASLIEIFLASTCCYCYRL